jgi:hypothetical protein
MTILLGLQVMAAGPFHLKPVVRRYVDLQAKPRRHIGCDVWAMRDEVARVVSTLDHSFGELSCDRASLIRFDSARGEALF